MAATAREWMSSDPVGTVPSAPLHTVASTLAAKGVTSLPVLREGHVIGIVSRSDLVRALARVHTQADWLLEAFAAPEDTGAERVGQMADFVAHRLGGMDVAAVMSSDPVTVDADDSIVEVARRLHTHRIHHAPVVEKGRLIGIISTFDIARWVAESNPAG